MFVPDLRSAAHYFLSNQVLLTREQRCGDIQTTACVEEDRFPDITLEDDDKVLIKSVLCDEPLEIVDEPDSLTSLPLVEEPLSLTNTDGVPHPDLLEEDDDRDTASSGAPASLRSSLLNKREARVDEDISKGMEMKRM